MSAPSFRMTVKVVPGASRSGIAGWLGDTLKVRVTTPPERGQANAAVESLLCAALGLPRGSVRIVSGNSSARKTVEVEGLSESDVLGRLSLIVP